MNAYHTIPEYDFFGVREPKEVWERYRIPAVAGKTVLDIGTWGGGFALEACRRGASRVVALDKFRALGDLEDYLCPPRDHIDLLKQRSGAAFEIVHHDITLPYAGQFDVVLFMQVFYHLMNPLAGLVNAVNCTNLGGQLVVETITSDDGAADVMHWLGHEESTDFWRPSTHLMETLFTRLGCTFEQTWTYPTHERTCWLCTRQAVSRYSWNSITPCNNKP